MKSFDFSNYIIYTWDFIFIIFLLLFLCYTHFAIIFGIFLFMIYFYRGKSFSLRFYPFYENFLSCPAEGRVMQIRILQNEFVCISIFLNLHNIHVQYAPCDGKVEHIDYFKGTFVPAYMFEKSSLNERQVFCIRTKKWGTIYISQIAGLLARRLVSFVREKQDITQGEPIGLIKFGSRVDIIVPCRFTKRVLVKKDQNVYIDQPIIEMFILN